MSKELPKTSQRSVRTHSFDAKGYMHALGLFLSGTSDSTKHPIFGRNLKV